jgi:nucleotide-binding universal stress UspA family protein
VLVAVHGYESPRWVPETCRLVSTWTESPVHLLAVLDVPRPPFTSLSRFARAAYDAARARWTELERLRLQPSLGALCAGLPADIEVSSVHAPNGDLALTIAREAGAWAADIVVVGPPVGSQRSWVRTGPVHERLVRLAPCTVVVITDPLGTPRGRGRLVAVPQPAVAGQGA